MSEIEKIEEKTEVVEEKKEVLLQPEEVKEEPTEEVSDQELNWKKFREKRAQEKEALAKAEREAKLLKDAVAELVNKESPADSYSEPVEESEEGRINRLVQEAIEQRDQKNFPNHLRQTFNDFDQVCTPENLEYLEFHEPEISKAFKYMPDGFEKWSSVYSMLKKKLPKVDSKKEKTMMQQNAEKPQSPSIPGIGQVGAEASLKTLSPARMQENWKRMQENMRG